MATNRDYYDVLGLRPDATADEIRKAYRRLARTHHPDVSQDPEAAEKFSRLTEAYEVLNDPEKRKTYDRFGVVGVRGGAGGAGPGGYGGGAWPPGAAVDMSDVGSIFEEMFGGASPFGAGVGAGPRGRGAGPQPRSKGHDLEHELSVSFLTAAHGGTERLRLSGQDGGPARTIKVRIPPGTETGARLRIKGSGQPSPAGGPPGDLILRIGVGKHPVFRRDGLDLLVDIPITVAEAALGVAVQVPLLAGRAEIKVPAGASSGRKLRIKGKGVTDAEGRTGDFYAIVQIIAPSELSDRARSLLEELANELQNPRESPPWADISGRSPDATC